jgi:drug/metabolite transporter (DMT)-like permease
MNRADLTILFVAAIWGTTFALLRDTLRVLHPVDLMALRFTMGAVVLAVIFRKRLWPVQGRWFRDGSWLGLWLAAGYLTQVIGLVTITASRSAFITGTYVAIVPIIAFFALRTIPTVGEFLGIGLVFAGLVAFSADAGFSLSRGDLWTLGCAVAFGIQIVITNIVVKRNDPMVLSVMQVSVAALVGWIIVAGRGGIATPWSQIPWGVLIYLSVVATSLVIAMQTWALGRTSPIKATLLFSTEPIFAAIFAGLFFGERMSGREVLGAALILLGVLVTDLWGRVRRWIGARRPGVV